MSGLSSFFPSKLLGSINPRERPADPLNHLRFSLETMPSSRKYVFTPATRAEILSDLYDAFWGPYSHLFLPNSNSSLPLHATLSEVQASLGFAGAGHEDYVIPGRPCGRIFKKGESCFRCKSVAPDTLSFVDYMNNFQGLLLRRQLRSVLTMLSRHQSHGS
jgi:E3 ubiquitin-protein ligase UBR1